MWGRIIRLGVAGAALSLAACTPETSAPPKQEEAPVSAAAPLAPAGEPVSVPVDTEQSLQWSAGVVQLDPLSKQGDLDGKLFGTAGGDPAMNGLYTYVAFFESPAEGWKVFKIGDFLEYRVIAESKGRVDLAIKESVMNDASGEISSRDRNIIVEWSVGADGALPTAITVTPAK
jgi:hypothetical protein